MQKRPLGRSGLQISVLTFGGWQAGLTSWTATTDRDSQAAMRAAYEAGINFFDTAEGYGEGHSEEVLGRFLKELQADDVYVASKVGESHLGAAAVRQSCETSLRRLQRETIDLYQIHWPAGTWGGEKVPIEETMGALLELQKEGKIGAIGVSNFNGPQIEAAAKLGRIESLQPPYSLFFQPYAHNGTVEVCLEHEMGIIAYSPLAQGLLTGKFNLENRPTDNREGNVLFQDPVYPLALDAVEKLRDVSARNNASTGQLALAWLLAQSGLTSAIVGTRTAQQMTDMAHAASLHISPEDLQLVSDIARPVIEAMPAGKTNPWA